MDKRKNTNRIIFHHSKSPDVPIETIKKWHTDKPPKGKGWEDIGYHFVIRADGVIETGRPLEMIGAHAKGRNKDSIGVCLTGDFNKESPTGFQLESSKALYYSECKKYGKNLAVEFHTPLSQEFPCPGEKLERIAFITSLRKTLVPKEESKPMPKKSLIWEVVERVVLRVVEWLVARLPKRK